MKKQILLAILSALLSDIGQVQAADFSSKALEEASAAYLKPNGAFFAMQQLERQDNGFVPLMLARCFTFGVSGCPKNSAKAQIYIKHQEIIQQKLQGLAQGKYAEAYNWLGNIERDSGTQIGKVQARQYFEKSAELNNAYAIFVIAGMYDTSAQGEKAAEWYEKATDLGNSDAMSNLGLMYANGRGVTKDEKKAVELYQKATDLGNSDAMFNLAVMYANGRGVTKDEKKAVELYQKATDLGDSDAMYNLGRMYANGRGVTKDEKKAVELYQKATDLGDSDAMSNLGLMYADGRGVTKDEKKAVELYQKAVDLGSTGAMSNLGLMYANGRGVTKDEKKAVELYQKATDLGNSDAMYNLGLMYADGRGVTKDEKKAVELYQKTADLGDADAIYVLGIMYYFGRGGLKGGMPEAAKWYQKSADLGHAEATASLGFMYAHGWGVPVDHSKAVSYLNKAIELGPKNAYAYWRLGVLYENGLGVQKNDKKTVELYQKAVDLGSTDAIVDLADHYLYGRGITVDVPKGLALYQRAVDLDNSSAMLRLAKIYLYAPQIVTKDENKALTLVQKAARLNDNESMMDIAKMYRNGDGLTKNPQKAIEIYESIANAMFYLSPNAMMELGRMYRDGEGVPQNTSKAIEYFKQPTRFGDYDGVIAIGYMYELGKGVKQDYNQAAEYYLKALKGDTFKRSSAKTYLADILDKVTDPIILKQSQGYFNLAPILTWSKKPDSQIEQEMIKLSVNLKDTGYGIGEVRLLVDGTPIDQIDRDFGSAQQGAEQRHFNVTLPKGRHTIRIEARNAENLGIPSVLEMQVDSIQAEIRKPKLYAIVIGVDQFKNDEFALKYAVADAKAIYEKIKSQVGGLYEEGSIHLLTSQQQTSKQNIQSVLDQVKQQAHLDDLFVFYVASHGTTFDDEYYMFTSDLLHTSKERAQKTAFSAHELQNLFVQVPTSKKIVFMDTCNSGGGIDSSKISSRDVMQDQKMIERMRERSGVTVLMASGSDQKALEGYQGHGVFTYALLQALSGKGDINNDDFVDSTELVRYVEDLVPDITKQEFKRTQTPFTSISGQSVAFKVKP